MLCVHLDLVKNLLYEIHEGIAEVTQGEDPWLTKRCPRDIGGHICKLMHPRVSESVTTARDLLP